MIFSPRMSSCLSSTSAVLGSNEEKKSFEPGKRSIREGCDGSNRPGWVPRMVRGVVDGELAGDDSDSCGAISTRK